MKISWFGFLFPSSNYLWVTGTAALEDRDSVEEKKPDQEGENPSPTATEDSLVDIVQVDTPVESPVDNNPQQRGENVVDERDMIISISNDPGE